MKVRDLRKFLEQFDGAEIVTSADFPIHVSGLEIRYEATQGCIVIAPVLQREGIIIDKQLSFPNISPR